MSWLPTTFCAGGVRPASDGTRGVEMIRAGMIGDVSEVYVWVGKGWEVEVTIFLPKMRSKLLPRR